MSTVHEAKMLTKTEPVRTISPKLAVETATLLPGREVILENGRPAQVVGFDPFIRQMMRTQRHSQRCSGGTVVLNQGEHYSERGMIFDQLDPGTELKDPEKIAEAVLSAIIRHL